MALLSRSLTISAFTTGANATSATENPKLRREEYRDLDMAKSDSDSDSDSDSASKYTDNPVLKMFFRESPAMKKILKEVELTEEDIVQAIKYEDKILAFAKDETWSDCNPQQHLTTQQLTTQQLQAANTVNNLLKDIIQIPVTKHFCYVHNVEEEILKKVLKNLKHDITKETSIQLTKRHQLAKQHLEAHEQHDKAHEHEQHDRKGKSIIADDEIPAKSDSDSTLNNKEFSIFKETPEMERLLRGEFTDEDLALARQEELFSLEYSSDEELTGEGESSDEELTCEGESRYSSDEELTWEGESRYAGEGYGFGARHPREATTKQQATTKEQKQACQTVNTVLKQIIQRPESKQICNQHDVDHELLTQVLENLENSITQEVVFQLAKLGQLAKRDQLSKRGQLPKPDQAHEQHDKAHEHEQHDRKGKSIIADDEIPASKKTRNSPDGDGEDILASKKI